MCADLVEDAVTRHYETVQLGETRVVKIKQATHERIDAMQATAEQQLSTHAKRVEQVQDNQLRRFRPTALAQSR